MRRLTLLIAAALVATLMTASMALAQGTMEDTAMTAGTGAEGDLPESGGPAIVLPAAALLLGSGILTYAVLRRR
jgi:hypothetical protein